MNDFIADTTRRHLDTLTADMAHALTADMAHALTAAGVAHTIVDTLTVTPDEVFRVRYGDDTIAFGEDDGWFTATRQSDDHRVFEGENADDLAKAIAEATR